MNNEQLAQQWYVKCFQSNELDSMDPADRQTQCHKVQTAVNHFSIVAKAKAEADVWRHNSN